MADHAPGPPGPDPAPPDEAARRRIRADLGATLFVEAGAGSGKTTALVERVVALVAEGGVDLARVAAITFTEKAGAELRDRVRRRLEELAGGGGTAGRRCWAALDQLDGAAVGTLHAFAQRLLREHPVEAGIPPRIEVLDEVSSGVDFDRRWTAFRDALLADPAMERSLLLLLAGGVRHDALRAVAAAFDDNWDLVASRVPASCPEPPPVADLLVPALDTLDAVCAEIPSCLDPADKLRARLEQVAAHVARLRALAAAGDEVGLVAALGPFASPKPPSFLAGNVGRREAWRRDVPALRARLRAGGEALEAVPGQVTAACAARLGAAVARFTVASAAARRAAGRLEFHDLLVLARALLTDPVHGPTVRARLHGRYTHLLLDEFQDTDPLQIELAVRIAARRPLDPAAGDDPWDGVEVADGHLFVVGDPKQSIYRFRRADIATFLRARERFAAGGAGVHLTANFRSGQPVVEWVNEVFARLLAEEPELEVDLPSRPPYVALQAVRPGPPAGPAVSVLGRTPHPRGAGADDVRAAEAMEVVAAVRRVVAEGWSVGDGAAPGGWRPARLGDVAVLVPARTSLPFLEDALQDAGVAYRAESSSLVYATRAVRDLLMVLRAADDPTDDLRIVAALRTPLLACGDDDLFRFRVEQGGRWSYLAGQPGTVPADSPVLAGLAYLRSVHDRRRWAAPSELLDGIARDRRAMELGVAGGRPRDVWRRIRFVVDQARAWADATGGSLRQYLHWVGLQTAEGARVAEAVLPETDDDAVRIMTVHAAKGLEFPVTVVSGLSTAPGGRRAAAQVVFPPAGGVGYRLGAGVATPEFVDYRPIDEQMGFDERIRLLYVACTRARDHLVVSLHRRERAGEGVRTARTNAELLVDGMGAELLASLPDAALSEPQRSPADLSGSESRRDDPPPPFAAWAGERDRAVAAAAVPTAVAATALTDEGTHDPGPDHHHDPDHDPERPDAGLQKRPRDLDLPPWRKGRYGSAVGRAVHGVLQSVDLATGAGLEAAVAAQCEAEAVADRAADVARLAVHGLAAPSVREAATRPHWREVYVATPVGGRVVEGYVDLLYRTGQGLVVVDHKTSSTADPAELDRRVEGYRLQGASYALAAAAATGEAVVRVTFVFLTPGGPVERHLDDLDGSVARVRALVEAGREVVVDDPGG